MKTPIIKPWINRDEEPRNVYELLGFALLDADRDALLAASESANEDLLNYQNIADAAKQTRALKLFEILGRFQAVLETPDLLRQHEDMVIEDLRTRCIGAFGNDSSRWNHPQLQQWLLHQRVHPASVSRMLGELLRSGHAPRDISALPRVFGRPGSAASSYLDPHGVDMSPPTVSAADLDANTVDLSDYIDQSPAANAAYKLLPLDGGPARAAPPPVAGGVRAAGGVAKTAKPPAATPRMPPPLPFAEPLVKSSGLMFFLAGAGIAGVVVLLGLGGWLLFSGKEQPAPKAVEPDADQVAEVEPKVVAPNIAEVQQPPEPLPPKPADGGPGAGALEQLRKALGASQLEARIKAVKDIRMLQPPPAPEAVFAELLNALGSGDDNLAIEAKLTLQRLGTPRDLGLTCDLLAEALKSKSLAPRQYAMETLAKAVRQARPGPADVQKKLESALFVALLDAESYVAAQAAEALQALGPFGPERHAELLKAMASGQREVRTFAFAALIRDFAEGHDELAASAVKAGHADVVRDAVKNWKKLGKQGRPLVMLALRHADRGIAQESVVALQAEKLGAVRLEDVREAQHSRHDVVRVFVVQSLYWPDLDAKTAVAVLKPALDDPEDTVKTAAVASLEKALDSNDERARRAAFACLESLEKSIPKAEQLLFAALKNNDATIRAKAVAAIRKYSGSTKKLIAEMRGMLGKTEEQTRAATLTLVELKADKELLTFIENSERDEDWLHVCKALLQKKPLPPVLGEALKLKLTVLEKQKTGPGRADAIEALSDLGAAVIPNLLPSLRKGTDIYKRVGVAAALGRMGPAVLKSADGKKAVELMRDIRPDTDNPTLLQNLREALEKIESP